MSEPQTEAQAFWATHCADCGHDLHPMDVCSTIVGGDQNGPDYCPCAVDYPMLAAEYRRFNELRNATLDEVLRVVEGLADAEWRDCPGACHDVTLAAVLDAVKALRS